MVIKMDRMTKLAFYGVAVFYLISMAYKMFTGIETQEGDATVLLLSGILFAAAGVALLVFIIVMYRKNKKEELQRMAEQMVQESEAEEVPAAEGLGEQKVETEETETETLGQDGVNKSHHF